MKLTVSQIKEQAAAKGEEARALQDIAEAEGRELTGEEIAKFSGLMGECEALEQKAGMRQRLEEAEARMNKPEDRKVKTELSDGSAPKVIVPAMYRYGNLKAFKGQNAQVNAYRSGRFLAATIFDHADSRQWCRDHGMELRRDTSTEDRAMGEGINSKGGFIVPDEFETTIIDLREQYGDCRRNLRIKPMASDHSNEPKKVGGLTAYPVGENVAITDSEQEWGNVELTAKKWGVLLRISNELSEDTLISLAEDIAMDVALAFATSEDEACIDGDGTAAYNGIVGVRTKMVDGAHLGSYVVNAGTGDNWSEIDAGDLSDCMAALPKYARRNAKWHISPLGKVGVFDRLLLAAGGNTNVNMAAPQQSSYAGYPIEEWPSMPTVDAGAALNGLIMMIFGDMTMSSKMGVRRGITLQRLIERYAEYDQIGIKATERFDINHHDIGGAAAATRGPVVGMQGTT